MFHADSILIRSFSPRSFPPSAPSAIRRRPGRRSSPAASLLLVLTLALAAGPFAATRAHADIEAGGSDAIPESHGEAAATTWARIRDETYDKKADYIAGYRVLMRSLDARIALLNAKRAKIPDTLAKDWDFAMQGLHDARQDMDDKLVQLKKTTSENWDDTKEKATASYQRAEDAYDKVRHSTTE